MLLLDIQAIGDDGLIAYSWLDDDGEIHLDYIDIADPDEGLDIPETA